MESHSILTTFVTAAFLGYMLLLVAQRLRISAIVILLAGGILAGPEFLGIVNPDDLGDGLKPIISLAVGLILFEGGLTLDIKDYRQASSEIVGVLTRGVIVTWIVSTLTIKAVFGFDWALCLLAGSLIIVTGPTVVGPLLRRVRVKKKLHNILYWEGVLIDPIGVFIALLCYEWILSAGAREEVFILNFLARFLVGITVGLSFGEVTYRILKSNLVSEERLNFFVLAGAMMNFAIADNLISESGLLSVTIAGFWLGYKDTPQLDRILEYKVELKDFLIGLLFILLAAHLDLSKFLTYGTALIGVVAVVMLVARPVNIFISTLKSTLTLKEKLFLSWIAPRGIVAASMSSLFAFQLQAAGYGDAAFLETFTYAVIVGTVVFQGFSARWVGKLLGVLEPRPKGWLVVGAHKIARAVAKFIQERGENVVLLDTNPREVKLSRREGLAAISESALTLDPSQHVELYGIGNVLAITPNEDLNQIICQRWQKIFSKAKIFYWGFEDFGSADNQSYRIVGHPVWTRFDLKTILAQNVQYDELITCTSEEPLQTFDKPGEVLMCEFEGKFYADPPAEGEGNATFLTLRPVKSDLSRMTSPDWVTFSDDSTIEKLFHRMLRILKRDLPGLDHDAIFNELMRREKEYSSMIGHGVALPHTYAGRLDESILMVAKLIPPIRCSHTRSEISLVFMVISPEGKPEEHLGQISRIAKFVSREEMREALMEAKSATELYEVIERG